MHLGWVDQGEGRYQGQMAVYVKPRGRLGEATWPYQALPALDRLPRDDETDRAGVDEAY